MKQHRADLVLGWMTKAHIYSGVAGKLAALQAVYYEHGLPDDGGGQALEKGPCGGSVRLFKFRRP